MRFFLFEDDEGAAIGVEFEGAHYRAGDIATTSRPEEWLQALSLLMLTNPRGLPEIDASEIRFLPAVLNPSKVIAIGLNYRDHCKEQGLPEPEFPTVFAKYPSSLTGHRTEVRYPKATSALDYEAELGIVIGKIAQNVTVDDAAGHIAGYAIVNDLTARDLQKLEKQFVRAKSFDGFAPCGPYLVPARNVPDPMKLAIRLWVNDELRQSSSTSEMVFGVNQLVSHLSQGATLLPGDLIITGTPAGVGFYREPQGLLKPGDRVRIELDGLGVLENAIVD